MKIQNCTLEDIDEIFRLYKIASDYQKAKKTVVVWPNFKKSLITNELLEKRQWKMVENDYILCIWAITYNDEQIWEEKSKDPAIYIHRIATNPNFRGNNAVAKIVSWAKKHAKQKNKRFIRLDTLGNNVKLIKHYKNAGFDFLGMYKLKNTDKLPEHYHTAPVCLFQIDLKKVS